LNYLLIPSLGIVGAALASLLTQFVANFVLLMIIPPLRGAFVLAVEGMTLKGLNTSAIRNWYCSITGKK
jgi:Na+-driven multidrug efflux pump